MGLAWIIGEKGLDHRNGELGCGLLSSRKPLLRALRLLLAQCDIHTYLKGRTRN